MNTPSSTRLALALCSVVASSTACDAGLEHDDAPEFRSGDSQGAVPSSGGGMWINNGLDDPDVSGIDPAFALSSEEGLAPTSPLLRDPERRDTVRYLVGCALPPGHAIEAVVDGTRLSFEGAVGLAPEWEDGECDEDCQQWVSACLLARTNVSGAPVRIWMRADHPAIGDATSPAYPVYEASFFGNLFEGTQHYCRDGGLRGTTTARLQGRTCTGLGPEACGFVEYTDCRRAKRCEYSETAQPGSLAMGSAVGCIGGALDEGRAYHTINTYLERI